MVSQQLIIQEFIIKEIIMGLYYNIYTYELKNIDDDLYNDWIINENPKVLIYSLTPQKPNDDCVWNNGEWIVLEQAVPDTISARQIRLWLLQNNISLQMVDDAINIIENTTLRDSVKIEWEYAPYVEKNHPMLVPLAQALGLTEEDINNCFIQAYNI